MQRDAAVGGLIQRMRRRAAMGGPIRRRAAESQWREARSSGERPDPGGARGLSENAGTGEQLRRWQRVDGLAKPVDGLGGLVNRVFFS